MTQHQTAYKNNQNLFLSNYLISTPSNISTFFTYPYFMLKTNLIFLENYWVLEKLHGTWDTMLYRISFQL